MIHDRQLVTQATHLPCLFGFLVSHYIPQAMHATHATHAAWKAPGKAPAQLGDSHGAGSARCRKKVGWIRWFMDVDGIKPKLMVLQTNFCGHHPVW